MQADPGPDGACLNGTVVAPFSDPGNSMETVPSNVFQYSKRREAGSYV